MGPFTKEEESRGNVQSKRKGVWTKLKVVGPDSQPHPTPTSTESQFKGGELQRRPTRTNPNETVVLGLTVSPLIYSIK